MSWYGAARPLLDRLDPERAHRLALQALAAGLVPAQPAVRDPVLATRLFGCDLDSPLGLAAGFDKNAGVFRRMPAQGFDFVEVGGVTPRPQAGNPRPRLFRLTEDGAVINRMGFNNDGLAAVRARLARHPAAGLLGVNLASNADSTDPEADFEALVAGFAPLAGYLTVDISCPNTANGKIFLDPDRLVRLLARLRRVRDRAPRRTALAVKISPDSPPDELARIVAVCLDAGVDGMVVANTTVGRPPTLRSRHRDERGGLSGAPLRDRALALLGQVYDLTQGRLPLIGVGGIASGRDAYDRIRAGADAVQLYSALVFHGPAVVTRIKRDLASLLRGGGFARVAEAVGADRRPPGLGRQVA